MNKGKNEVSLPPPLLENKLSSNFTQSADTLDSGPVNISPSHTKAPFPDSLPYTQAGPDQGTALMRVWTKRELWDTSCLGFPTRPTMTFLDQVSQRLWLPK